MAEEPIVGLNDSIEIVEWADAELACKIKAIASTDDAVEEFRKVIVDASNQRLSDDAVADVAADYIASF